MQSPVVNQQSIQFNNPSVSAAKMGNPLDSKFYNAGKTASNRNKQQHGSRKGGKKRSYDDLQEELHARGIMGKVGSMMGMGAMMGGGGGPSLGSDTNTNTLDHQDYSNHAVHSGVSNNQMISFRGLSDDDEEQYLGKRLSFGSDTNSNALDHQDYSNHAVHAGVHNNQMISFRDLPDDEEQYLGKRLSFGSDTNYNTLDQQDYSNHAVYSGVHNNQMISFRDLADDEDVYLGKRLLSLGSDTNSNSLSGLDYSNHAVHAGVHNNQMISFRGLDEDEDYHMQARGSTDGLDVLRALQNDPDTANLLSGIDIDQLEQAGSGNYGQSSDNVVINDATTNHVDHSGNTGVIMNDHKIDLGSGQAAKDFSTWTMRKRLIGAIPVKAAAPAPAPAGPTSTTVNSNSADSSSHNNANLGANSGTIANSGNTIAQQDTCTLFIDRRDFHGDSLLPRAYDKTGGSGGQKKSGGSGYKGGQQKAANGNNGQHKSYGSGGNKGQSGGNKGQYGGANKQQGGKSSAPKPAPKPSDSCKCQCASRRSFDERSVSISGPDTRIVQAFVERSCSIVQDNETQQHKWHGDCKRSTVAGRPVMEMFPRAHSEL